MMFNPFDEIPAFCHECGPQAIFLRYYWGKNASDPIAIYLFAIEEGSIREVDFINITDQNIQDHSFNDQCVCCGHHFPYNVDLDTLQNKNFQVGFRI